MNIIHNQTNHALPDGELKILTNASRVAPTINLLEIGGTKLLIDCGAPTGARRFEIPKEALQAEALIITHAHFDHVGSIPDLLKAGFQGPIYATPATDQIMRHLLHDSIGLQGGTNADQWAFAEKIDKQIKRTPYNKPTNPIKGKDLTFTFKEAGHILGSASIELQSPKTRIIISGDLGRPNSPILRDYNTTWSQDREIDLVLLESTYGDKEHEAIPEDVEGYLERVIKKARQDGGHILVPSFAIGRTQTLLYLLNNLVESKRIEDLPVAVDTPLGLKVTNTYKHFQRLYDKESLDKLANGDDPIDFDYLYAVRRKRESARLDRLKETMLIIAGSGMCTGGRMVGHLKELLIKPETNIIFVGHQVKGTPGQQIQEAGKDKKPGASALLDLFGELIPMKATVDTIPGLSAHADQRELANWLKAIPNPKKVALHHGDKKAQETFASIFK